MEFTRRTAVPWGKDAVRDRDYNPLAAAVVIEYAEEEEGELPGTSLTSWRAVRGVLRKDFGMSRPKQDKTVEALVRTGAFVRLEEGLLSKTDHRREVSASLGMFTDSNKFVALPPNWLNWCWEAFGKDCMAAKTVFSLYRAGEWMKSEGGPTEYRFSVAGKGGLLERLGYDQESGSNRERMRRVLDRMESDGIIVLSAPQRVKSGYGYSGAYRYLLGVGKPPSGTERRVVVSFAADTWRELSEELRQRGIDFTACGKVM